MLEKGLQQSQEVSEKFNTLGPDKRSIQFITEKKGGKKIWQT